MADDCSIFTHGRHIYGWDGKCECGHGKPLTIPPAQSDAPSAEPPYPTNAGLPVNVAQWKEMFDAGECLNCGEKLTGKAQWECCWFGLIPEMWWRMTAAYAALRTAKMAEKLNDAIRNVDLSCQASIALEAKVAQLARELAEERARISSAKSL